MNRRNRSMPWCAALLLLSALLPAARPQDAPATATSATPSTQAPARTVREVPRARIDQAAARIDQILDRELERRAANPTPQATDAEFCRRAHLAITGRIPTPAETERFLADEGADKRNRLVDQLLDAPGSTGHMANFWFDLLRVKSRQRQLSGEPFAHWIREAVRTGMPYDDFVAAMVTATGSAHAEGNGATGFLLRDMNMPHDAMANTLRVFTGTRLECAQCHNHPFEQWKQREFFAMAAFYGGLQYRAELPADAQRALRELATSGDDRQKQRTRNAIQSASIGLRGSGTGVERLPQDYAYDDLAPRTPIPAASIFGPKTKVEPKTQPAQQQRQRPFRAAQTAQRGAEADSRAVFAEWLTSKENERFTRVIVNRMWQRLFGRALTEPLDDLKDDSKAIYPELERQLQRLLVELDFDLRQFQRVLLSTKLFSRKAVAADADAPFCFEGPFQQRLAAEQIWDSLLTLQDERIDERLPATDARAKNIYSRQEAMLSGDPERIQQGMQRRPDAEEQARMRVQQIAERRAQDQERQKKLRELTQQILAARRKGDAQLVEQLLAERVALALPSPQESAVRDGQFARASDLEQPAAASHALRQFGQSDRETVDGAARSASVPQALSLLNGPLGNAQGSVHRRIADASNAEAKVRIAFLAVLTRMPHEDERALWEREFRDRPRDAAADLVWVLVNSHEFRFCP